ncbi:PDZ and LIM domain protein Zasp isoform X4 [Plutella xylostella]|uniref:PDZ and LIM domain protein Zasp isoform X3 n=1 Tax=Plutella xylostella TaxID=51655 RepID=UPI002032AF00|nr:PDZ and LIM domain protein Zasp isoform X3 [Plutella xylostella]XP_048485234.1 PDZ and LIM domain protein Zasp isoform X4 [Plutella xylostella]
MAQLITVRLSKADHQPLGFRLQGGKDFGTPLVVQKVNGGSSAERAGLQAGDALIRVNSTDVYTLRHQEAQDAIRAAGASLELTVQRGGGTWRPAVTPTGSLPRPGSRLSATPTPVTNTSLKANPQPSRPIGSGHNNVAKPFGYMNGNDNSKSIVNKQYNTPVNMYSEQTIAETLSAQTEVLAGGVLGVNFKKNEKTYDAEKSAVFKVLQEEQNDPEPEVVSHAPSGLRPVAAPVTRPDAPLNTGGLPPGQNICEDCERLITGVFVRIKDKNLHVECFKCATCGTSLKNQGYYNLNGKLYCDIHAKLAARAHPPAAGLEPVTVPPGGRVPSNAYSTPLPPLATNNNNTYSNGSSSMFSPSSNVSGPKPFGSSLGSAYSPSLSPRSAPMSPARPAAAPAPAYNPAPVSAPAYNPAPVSAPAYNPAPVSAPAYNPAPAPVTNTNDMPNVSSPLKPEFKSPAEERLIRKMAKMALNGYEIGIQRKIKPANHIQSMADMIQDTVVTKHPLNADSLSSSDSSRESTLKKPLNKHIEKTYKTPDHIQNIGDRIKDTILNNHPMNTNYTNGSFPPPPPIPQTPIPTTVAHSTPIHSVINDILKRAEETPKELNYSLDNSYNKSSERNGNGYEDYKKENKSDNSFYLNTLKKNNFMGKVNDHSENVTPKQEAFKPDNKINNGYSNTLNKRKLFERQDNISNGNMDSSNTVISDKTDTYMNNSNSYKNIPTSNSIISDKTETYVNNSNTYKNIPTSNTVISDKTDTYMNNSNTYKNIPKKTMNDENYSKMYTKDEREVKTNLLNTLRDNTLYNYKTSPKLNGTNGIGNGLNGGYKPFNGDNTEKYNERITPPNGTASSDETESVVKRRPKKTDRDNDGKRDSHIVARPLSTMTSEDVADGLYPVCHVCDKSITRGPFITALGRIWCPDHFVCVNATCRRALQDIGFVEENGQLYCEYCFEQYIAPACDKCHGKIKGDCLNAIGKHYHPECFNCVYCNKLFGNNPFFLEDGLPYCEADWNELFTTKCFACGFPVEAGDRWVEALNNNYHSQCFNCTVCKKNLEGQSFFAKGGRPFCKLHAR